MEISISEFKKLKANEITAKMPITLTSDGQVIGQVVNQSSNKVEAPKTRQTKCPNCKLVYVVVEPDGKLPFFSGKHPKGGV